MSGFREMVEADLHGVFLNCDEFAERRTVIYDGVRFDRIPVVLTRLQQSKTPLPVTTSHWDGLRTVSARAHIALSDLGGTVPREGEWIRIEDGEAMGEPLLKRYLIVTSGEAMGMATLELEAKED